MKKLLCILFALVLLPVAALTYNGDMTVYITDTGECYHMDGCTSLRRSAYAIRLEDAVNSGYQACRNCGTPYRSNDLSTRRYVRAWTS